MTIFSDMLKKVAPTRREPRACLPPEPLEAVDPKDLEFALTYSAPLDAVFHSDAVFGGDVRIEGNLIVFGELVVFGSAANVQVEKMIINTYQDRPIKTRWEAFRIALNWEG
tara:strand:- start:4077 stop:4409 length:333 start_codon:yes stop_codon:yes gene_type:complete